MTERGRKAVTRTAENFHIGPSNLSWDGDTLVIAIDEISAPIPRRVRGTIRVTPQMSPQTEFTLDAAGRHIWQPIAPAARIAVEMEKPGLSWSGSAYLDSNRGTEPLEAGFKSWTWSRAHAGKDAIILYDCKPRGDDDRSLAIACRPGGVEPIAPPPTAQLPGTLWRISRMARTDAGTTCRIERTLEDTPFYARSIIETSIGGTRMKAFHESLSLDRFASPVVRAMLPFRMPRLAGR